MALTIDEDIMHCSAHHTFVAFVASFITKKTYSMTQLQTRTRGEQTSLIDEIVGNEKVVQAFNHEDEALEQFDEINDRLQKCSLRA